MFLLRYKIIPGNNKHHLHWLPFTTRSPGASVAIMTVIASDTWSNESLPKELDLTKEVMATGLKKFVWQTKIVKKKESWLWMGTAHAIIE